MITLCRLIVVFLLFIFNIKFINAQPLPDGERLKHLAAQHDILIGSQSSWGNFVTNKLQNNERKAIVNREYNAHTGGAGFSPKRLQPSEGVFYFERADELIDTIKNFSSEHKIHAAHLVGRNIYMPDWWINKSGMSTAQQINLLKNHINRVVSHYKGKVAIWDVTNEVLNNKGFQGRWHWANAMYLRKIGSEPMSNTSDSIPTFIRLAFEYAEANDPDAVKIVNEPQNASFGEAFTEICYEMVEDLKNRSVPIDGVGFQMHLKVDSKGNLLNSKGTSFSIDDFKANMQRYADLGVDIYITELDIAVPKTNATHHYEAQRQAYYDIVSACLSQPRCRSILMWGFDDASSWKESRKPTIFDANREAKPAYYGVQKALEKAPVR